MNEVPKQSRNKTAFVYAISYVLGVEILHFVVDDEEQESV